MKQDIAIRWVAALRSGEYKQGQKYLRQGDNYCCLGVLCDLVKDKKGINFAWEPNHINKQEYPKDIYFLRMQDLYVAAVLPSGVNRLTGIETSSEAKLTIMNDIDMLSFNELADYIEQNWETL